ncbi:S-layer homology domain-containing protein, partial [Myxococcota bacterium]
QDPLLYCPDKEVTRSTAAVLLLRARHGPQYVPASPQGLFEDVSTNHWAAGWIEELYQQGITKGCAQGPLRFCPDQPVTRRAMAVLLLRARHGQDFLPGVAAGIYEDVDLSDWAGDWTEQLYHEGITKGCSQNPLRFCPDNPVTRSAMALLLVRAFDLYDRCSDASFCAESFADVEDDDWASDAIDTILHAGITKGCAQDPLLFCPNKDVTRATAAVLLLRAKYGRRYSPPAATGIFEDVPTDHWAVGWMEQLYREGITKGCAQDPLRFCPNTPLKRAPMAVLMLRTKHGASYEPPDAMGLFPDVLLSGSAVGWMEQLYHEGITTGCHPNRLAYCPDGTVSRAAMAVLLVRAFDLDDSLCDGDLPGFCGDRFSDVPEAHSAREAIYDIYRGGITKGCSQDPLLYCPDEDVTRATAAVLLLRAKYGRRYSPPAATGIFEDVPADDWAAGWMEQLYREGITNGCSQDPLSYCPNDPLKRGPMAVLVLRAKHGRSFVPPDATGVFDDVEAHEWPADWVERLYDERITKGCSQAPLRFCPDRTVNRAAMAVLLARAFEVYDDPCVDGRLSLTSLAVDGTMDPRANIDDVGVSVSCSAGPSGTTALLVLSLVAFAGRLRRRSSSGR